MTDTDRQPTPITDTDRQKMANFKKNPLFRKVGQAARRAAQQEWQRTDAAKAVNQIRSALNTRGGTNSHSSVVAKAARQWGRGGWSDIARSTLLGGNFGEMVREVDKYSKMGGSTGRLLAQFLGELGPVGSLIKNLVSMGGKSSARKPGVQGDIDSALAFLDAVAPETVSSGGRSRIRPAGSEAKRSTGEVADQINAATNFLEEHGFEVKPKARRAENDPIQLPRPVGDPKTSKDAGVFPGGQSRKTARGGDRQIVELEVDGRVRRFKRNHPIITKEMTRTPESSNVYAFSYDYDSWTLYIRFQSHIKGSNGPGSLYGYSNVPPDVFLKMLKAPSKGVFVWDSIRIRGTHSGHRYDYRLVSVRNNYVPRKATMTASGEMFIQRIVKVRKSGKGKSFVLKSGADMAPSYRAYPE